jgi:carboxymethylenebutenolidase
VRVSASTVSLPSTDATDGVPAYDVSPDGQPRGGVVVVQEAFGVNDHIEDVARRFAAEGYRAIAPHLFHRTGDPKIGYTDFAQVMPQMSALTTEGILVDVDAALAAFERDGVPASKVAIIGFCMGGTVATMVGAERELGAAVSFYGGGVAEARFGGLPLIEVAPSLRTPWLGLYGDEDTSIPVDQIEQLREAAARSSVPTEIVRYAGAQHGFHCDQRPDNYDEASAKDAWGRAIAFLRDRIG